MPVRGRNKKDKDAHTAAGPPGRQLGFVLDAIVDAQDQPWFLEVNSNPQWHPDIYAPMLDGLCGIQGVA